MDNTTELKRLKEKIEKARTVITNLKSFKDWNFAAYKVEAHEKDIIIEGMSSFLSDLQDVYDKLEEKSDDDTELCE